MSRRVLGSALDVGRPWVPQVVLDRELRIRACNAAFGHAIGWRPEELVGLHPSAVAVDNPKDPSTGGAERLIASLERVLRSAQAEHMTIQRHDLPDRSSPGAFVPRYWMPLNSPLVADGRLIGVIHEVRDISALRPGTLTLLERVRAATESRGLEPAERLLIDTAAALVDEMAEVRNEVTHLTRALTSRATIDLARGMVMATHGCGPDEAFNVLRSVSNNTNVRLAEVAASLVHDAEEPRRRNGVPSAEPDPTACRTAAG